MNKIKPTFKDKQKTLGKRKQSLKNRPTLSEIFFRRKLDSLKIKYIFQKGFIAGDNYCIVDFYLPKPYKICVEINGGYHDSIDQTIKDAWRYKYLNERNFRVWVLTNEEANNITEEEIEFTIEYFVEKFEITRIRGIIK